MTYMKNIRLLVLHLPLNLPLSLAISACAKAGATSVRGPMGIE